MNNIIKNIILYTTIGIIGLGIFFYVMLQAILQESIKLYPLTEEEIAEVNN